MALGLQGIERLQQQVELGRAAVILPVHKRRVDGDLPQSQQSLQDPEACVVHALALEQAQDLGAVPFPGLDVDLFLGRLHFGVDDPFGARRELGRHLVLGAAQDEGVDQFPQERRSGFIPAALDGVGKLTLEILHVPQQARVEEGKLRPELEGVVLHGRAGHHNAVVRFQQPRGFGLLRQRILDRLQFVQDDVTEPVAAQDLDVAQHRAVGGQHHIIRIEHGCFPAAQVADVFEEAQTRREVLRTRAASW